MVIKSQSFYATVIVLLLIFSPGKIYRESFYLQPPKHQ